MFIIFLLVRCFGFYFQLLRQVLSETQERLSSKYMQASHLDTTSRTQLMFEVSTALCLNNQDSCSGLYITTPLSQNQFACRIEVENASDGMETSNVSGLGT